MIDYYYDREDKNNMSITGKTTITDICSVLCALCPAYSSSTGIYDTSYRKDDDLDSLVSRFALRMHSACL